MDTKSVSLPEVYTDSADFRFFINWFAEALAKIQYDTENIIDLYDPQRCPEDLVWLLADTMGYKYDDRLPTSFNRLVLLYFMSMIRNRGSKNGVTLAAETNLAQLHLLDIAAADSTTGHESILYNRLDDTSVPANAVSVTTHTAEGYIDIVYFSTRLPLDACIEYVRPLGMFVFPYAGVKFDGKTKISVDARLTDNRDRDMSFGPMQVGQYRRTDYATLQKMTEPTVLDESDTRQPVWYRNSEYEDTTNPNMNPGYRAISSLQLSNNDEVMKSLLDPLFTLGFDPQDIDCPPFEDNYVRHPSEQDKNKPYNLRYDPYSDETLAETEDDYILTLDETGAGVIDPSDISIVRPYPAVNPVMSKMGDAISKKADNSEYYQFNIDDD